MPDVKFFRHYDNEQEKAKAIIIRYGAKGYGIYWYVLERLYFSFNREFEAGKAFYYRASMDMHASKRIVRKVLYEMEQSGAVTMTGNVITSGRVEREIQDMSDARMRRQQASRKAWKRS